MTMQLLAFVTTGNLTNVGPRSKCSSAGVNPISNSSVSSPDSTYYNLANCNPTLIPDFSVTGPFVSATRGVTGTSTASVITSNGSQSGSQGINGKRNIEVTFIPNVTNAYLDIIAYGDGVGTSFNGPTWRITSGSNRFSDQNGINSTSQIAYKGQDGVFRAPIVPSTFSTGVLKTISVGLARTYCLDFHAASSNGQPLLIAWDSNCANVSSSQKSGRANYPIYTDTADAISSSSAPVAPAGTKIGFIANGVTFMNFTVSSQLSTD